MKKLLAISCLSLALAGCATSYQAAGFFKEGYTSELTSPTTAKVVFSGNARTDIANTYGYAMKQAAELTMQHGYRYFEVTSHRNYLKPITSETTAGTFTNDFPVSEVVIQFVKTKTPKAYDAQKVFGQIQS